MSNDRDNKVIEQMLDFINSGRHLTEDWPKEFATSTPDPSSQDEMVGEASPLIPPWQKYPNISFGSIGWRMGPGEEYWVQFLRWIRSISPEEFVSFRERYPEPTGWEGFYDLVRPE